MYQCRHIEFVITNMWEQVSNRLTYTLCTRQWNVDRVLGFFDHHLYQFSFFLFLSCSRQKPHTTISWKDSHQIVCADLWGIVVSHAPSPFCFLDLAKNKGQTCGWAERKKGWGDVGRNGKQTTFVKWNISWELNKTNRLIPLYMSAE